MLYIVSLFMVSLITTSPDEAAAKRIDKYLSQAEKQGFSGAVLVAKKGNILLRKGYGLANREAQTPFTENTVTTIGSITKQFTATAILKLASTGKLTVGDTLDQYFEDLPEDKKKITIHQLLTHSAGLADIIGDGDFDMMTKEAYFHQLFASKLRYEPGARHRYSNASYSLLAHILEKVTGRDYETFLYEHLFKPAGMTDTGYLRPQWPIEKVARGYTRGVIDQGTLVSRFRQHKSISWVLKGNGGIHSTLNDMYLWYLALKENKILTPNETEQLTRPYIAESADESSHYAYGWAIFRSDRDTKIVSHNGSNGTFFYDFLWLPEEDAIILFSTNGIRPELELAWPIERMLFNPSYQPKPIGPNPYAHIHAHITTQQPDSAQALLKQIQKGKWVRSPHALNEMGYRLLEGNPAWAVALFEINSQLFPEVSNVWDSLGEGYLETNQRHKAIECYRKAAKMGDEHAADMLTRITNQN